MMIQMNQNQVVYKYIKIEDSLKTFVKEKENQAKNLSKKWNTFEEEDCGSGFQEKIMSSRFVF